VALLRKMTCNLGDPMSLGHPVSFVWFIAFGVAFAIRGTSLISFISTYILLHLQCHFFIHMGSHSYVISFILDLIHNDVHSVAFAVSFLHSYGITFICVISSFILDHIHMSYGITFICPIAFAVSILHSYRSSGINRLSHRMPYLHRSFSAKEPYN